MSHREELLAERNELVCAVREIDTKLTQRKPTGRVSNSAWNEYQTWRGNALYAKNKKLARLSEIKAELRCLPAKEDDVGKISRAVIGALLISDDSVACAKVFSAVSEVLTKDRDTATA